MTVLTYGKDIQGQAFRLEVAHVTPPEVLPDERVLGVTLTLECCVLGFPTGTSVEFRIFEPFSLHETPVDTISAKTADDSRVVSAEWTLDYDSKKDKLTSTRFVCVVQVGNLVNISEPFEVLEELKTTVQDANGKPIPNTPVLLRAAGRRNIEAETDGEGALDLLVPPGDYIIEVRHDLGKG